MYSAGATSSSETPRAPRCSAWNAVQRTPNELRICHCARGSPDDVSFFLGEVFVVRWATGQDGFPPTVASNGGAGCIADRVTDLVVVADRVVGLCGRFVAAAVLEKDRVGVDVLFCLRMNFEQVGERLPHGCDALSVAAGTLVPQCDELAAEHGMFVEDQVRDVRATQMRCHFRKHVGPAARPRGAGVARDHVFPSVQRRIGDEPREPPERDPTVASPPWSRRCPPSLSSTTSSTPGVVPVGRNRTSSTNRWGGGPARPPRSSRAARHQQRRWRGGIRCLRSASRDEKRRRRAPTTQRG